MKVLVAPLDWGLGHATRCVPIVHAMLQLGWEVTLAGEGPSLRVLTDEFPQLTTLPLKGYRMNYPKKGGIFWLKLLLQVPKMLNSIRLEQEWLKTSLEKEHWDLIISDNRYGLSNPNTKCVFITHQLWVLSGWGNRIDQLLNKRLHQWINQFSECWVPDAAHDGGIAGQLSHPTSPCSLSPVPLKYMGPLSRLNSTEQGIGENILILLSGPEPQRTILEEKIIQQVQEINGQFLLVRGLPNATDTPKDTTQLIFKNHLTASELSAALSSAKLVVCRSGYSSIMDLLKLKKKAILIPTPGQTEQLYLAQYMEEKNWFMTADQDEFQLSQAIPLCLSSNYTRPTLNFEWHQQVLEELITQ